MIGRSFHAGVPPDLAHGGEPVHLRHHDVHQDQIDRLTTRLAAARERGERLAAVTRDGHLCAFRLEHVRQREDVAGVVFDDQNPPAFERRLAGPRHLEHPLSLHRQRRFDLVKEQRHLVEQPLRRPRVLDDDRLREAAELLLLVASQRAPGVDDDGWKRHLVLLGHLLEQLVAAQIGQVQVHHHAVERRRLQRGQRLGRGLDAGDLDVVAPEEMLDALALPAIVFDDEQPAGALRQPGLEPLEDFDELFALDRLERVADRAAFERLMRVIGDREHVHGNVARLRGALELIEHAEARVVGQVDVEQDRAWRELARGGQAVAGRVGDDALKPHLVREIAQHAGKARVVFDDEDAP